PHCSGARGNVFSAARGEINCLQCHPSVPSSVACQCPAVSPISAAHQCHPSMMPSSAIHQCPAVSPVSAAQQCHLSVLPSSATCQCCPSVSPISAAHQC
ncbi:unnamed protein product, partial [Staurois parvus]